MDSILILDFGSQYTQLIARRVRELNTFAEIKPWNGDWRTLLDTAPEDDPQGRNWKGVILSGSPHSVREANAPSPDLEGVRAKWPCPRRLLRRPVARPEWRRQCSRPATAGNTAGPI